MIKTGDRPSPELLARAAAVIRADRRWDGPLCLEDAICSFQFDGLLVVYVDDVRIADLQRNGGGTSTTFLVQFKRDTMDLVGLRAGYRTRVEADGRYKTLPPE